MRILVIDGQGGRIGRELIEGLSEYADCITAVGTNSIATENMLKARPDAAATGENAVCVACRTADIIAGPLGIVIADSFIGEITPKMAEAVGQSAALKVLIPVNRCNNIVAGVQDLPLSDIIADAVLKIRNNIDKTPEK